MKSARPYQPLLLRILHGLTGLFLIAAILTAYWTYDTYDGRWGGISLPSFPAVEGIHGTFGLYTLLIFPAFVIYAFHKGQKRLIQSDSFSRLAQTQEPFWWYNLNRFTNTFTLVALTFSLFSGKMMDSAWLPQGELNHAWYYAHLVGWVVTVVAIALHLLINAKVGGAPWLLSMLEWRYREKDSPRLWAAHLSSWWAGSGWRSWLSRFRSVSVLRLLEAAILLSLVAAWIIPYLPGR